MPRRRVASFGSLGLVALAILTACSEEKTSDQGAEPSTGVGGTSSSVGGAASSVGGTPASGGNGSGGKSTAGGSGGVADGAGGSLGGADSGGGTGGDVPAGGAGGAATGGSGAGASGGAGGNQGTGGANTGGTSTCETPSSSCPVVGPGPAPARDCEALTDAFGAAFSVARACTDSAECNDGTRVPNICGCLVPANSGDCSLISEAYAAYRNLLCSGCPLPICIGCPQSTAGKCSAENACVSGP